ncbi:MAG: 5-formyltetrahydrofolate cyclo-ligase [Caulobacterales bacterium]
MDHAAPPSDAKALAAWRRATRERLIAERMTMPLAARRAASRRIGQALAGQIRRAEIAVLGAYWPVRGEYDCVALLRRLLAGGCQVALPVVLAAGRPLEFRAWTPKTPMESGPQAIPHPAAAPAVTPGALLIPLVGFDEAGWRLGYGGGFYDRTLAALSPKPLAIGVGFELGRLASIGPGPHDRPMDYIITEVGLVHGPEEP